MLFSVTYSQPVSCSRSRNPMSRSYPEHKEDPTCGLGTRFASFRVRISHRGLRAVINSPNLDNLN